eukprot:TRINITY_DN20124_c0_g2_i1.p3 TRINITY_DN20124_c0_g2~~TRINITY_DN20124_c0_g2_i1.p3  ORF type:complete len:221 (+),score=59.02 TRINITY_DN20124_c0_g2_i1:71-733(+)
MFSRLDDGNPFWARKYRDKLGQASSADDDLTLAAADAAQRRAKRIRSQEDILGLLGQGPCGLVIDEAFLAQAYPGAARDIARLAGEKGPARAVRVDDAGGGNSFRAAVSGGLSASTAPSAAAASEAVPVREDSVVGLVLFARFEPAVEARRADADIREAFHSLPRIQAGDLRPVLAPPPPEEALNDRPAKKRTRRAATSTRALQNAHMAAPAVPSATAAG